MATDPSIPVYYDAFKARLLEDYLVQNQRVVSALEFADQALEGVRSVLDIGCGIGWSTHHLARNGRYVLGLDISPALVEAAQDMFGVNAICVDFTDWREHWWQHAEAFDAVVMIDVYEHFARDRRDWVHKRIKALDPRFILLAVPTPEAMAYAREHDIELQPIDEDVTEHDIEQLASDVGGAVEINRTVSIWRPDDYRHVLIRR